MVEATMIKNSDSLAARFKLGKRDRNSEKGTNLKHQTIFNPSPEFPLEGILYTFVNGYCSLCHWRCVCTTNHPRRRIAHIDGCSWAIQI